MIDGAFPVNFRVIKYFLDMLRNNPEHNTLVVGKRFDSNLLFASALVSGAKISGFYVYPNCRFFFLRRWTTVSYTHLTLPTNPEV